MLMYAMHGWCGEDVVYLRPFRLRVAFDFIVTDDCST